MSSKLCISTGRQQTPIFLNNGGVQNEKYERTELEVVEFETEDVIMTSGIEYEDDELPLTPNR